MRVCFNFNYGSWHVVKFITSAISLVAGLLPFPVVHAVMGGYATRDIGHGTVVLQMFCKQEQLFMAQQARLQPAAEHVHM